MGSFWRVLVLAPSVALRASAHALPSPRMFAAVAAWFMPAGDDKLKGSPPPHSHSIRMALMILQRGRAISSHSPARSQPPQGRHPRSLPQCRQSSWPRARRPPPAPAGARTRDGCTPSCSTDILQVIAHGYGAGLGMLLPSHHIAACERSVMLCASIQCNMM